MNHYGGTGSEWLCTQGVWHPPEMRRPPPPPPGTQEVVERYTRPAACHSCVRYAAVPPEAANSSSGESTRCLRPYTAKNTVAAR